MKKKNNYFTFDISFIENKTIEYYFEIKRYFNFRFIFY